MGNGARTMFSSMDCISMQQINKIKGLEKSPQSIGQNNLNSESAEESDYSNDDVSLNFRAQGSGFPVIKLTYTKFLLVGR